MRGPVHCYRPHIACLSFYSLAMRLFYFSYSAAFMAIPRQEDSHLVLEPLLGIFLKSSWCSNHCAWSSRRQVEFILIRTLKRIAEGTRLMFGPNRVRAQRRFKVATRMERRLMFGSAQRSLKQATVMERRLTRREGRWVRLEEVDGWWNGTGKKGRHDLDLLIGSYINRKNYPILENTSLQKQDLTIW